MVASSPHCPCVTQASWHSAPSRRPLSPRGLPAVDCGPQRRAIPLLAGRAVPRVVGHGARSGLPCDVRDHLLEREQRRVVRVPARANALERQWAAAQDAAVPLRQAHLARPLRRQIQPRAEHRGARANGRPPASRAPSPPAGVLDMAACGTAQSCAPGCEGAGNPCEDRA
jgi:hypothetical protein